MIVKVVFQGLECDPAGVCKVGVRSHFAYLSAAGGREGSEEEESPSVDSTPPYHPAQLQSPTSGTLLPLVVSPTLPGNAQVVLSVQVVRSIESRRLPSLPLPSPTNPFGHGPPQPPCHVLTLLRPQSINTKTLDSFCSCSHLSTLVLPFAPAFSRRLCSVLARVRACLQPASPLVSRFLADLLTLIPVLSSQKHLHRLNFTSSTPLHCKKASFSVSKGSFRRSSNSSSALNPAS